jgi:hypothetical protein
MGPGTLAARAPMARDRIAAAAQLLAKRFGIELGGPPPGRPPVRDPHTRAMLAQEDAADLLERLLEATSPAADIPTPADVAQGHTVAELLPIIAEADADQLDRIEQAEKDGKDRAGVHNAIEKRRLQLLEELENEAPEDGPDPDAE